VPLTPQQMADFQRLKQAYAMKPQRKAKGGLAKFLTGTKVKERVYHGTGNLEGLTSFDPAKTGKGTDQLGSGFYFTTHPDEASDYAGYRHPNREEKNSSPGVVAAHLAIKKPIKIGPKGSSLNDARINLSHDQVKQIIGHAPKILDPDESPINNHVDTSRGVTPKMIHDIARMYTGNNLHALENDMFPDDPTAYRHALHKVTGHDGVVKDFGDGRKHYVAWFPEQVKSAIGNSGAYDPNNPDITKAKGGKIEVRPTVFDDAASRRNPKIEEAARALLAGNIKQKDYEKLVAKEKPVKPYSFIPKPATDEQAMKVLIDRQKQNWRSHESWPAGHPVGLRLDIPAYERHGVWVNSVHDESGQKPAFPTSYGPVSSVRNAEFHGSPHKAARVATGEQTKTPFARIMGNIEHMDEEQAVKHFQKYMNHPDYRQIGYDPRRHGDFYDRETMQPVTHSEHVVQIGPLVLAKKPVYGKRTVYAKGGKVTHAHHLEIEERPL